MVTVGVLPAYLAGRTYHPHTHGLTAHAKLVLEQHDFWADWTINLGIIGDILQGVNLFVLIHKRWPMAVVALVLVGASYSIFHAGHYAHRSHTLKERGPRESFWKQGKAIVIDRSSSY